MSDLDSILNKLSEKEILSRQQAYTLQKQILSGRVNTETLLKVFEHLSERIIDFQELSGILAASEEAMTAVPCVLPTLDTCSTGGDGLDIFNVSTLAAIVCASLNVPVAKHGNRSASSKHGSFDLLEKLQVNFQLNSQQASQLLDKTGLVFLFAPIFHPAFGQAKEARTQFGKPTYFNFLGPLLNPTHSHYQVIGVSNAKMAVGMGRALIESGSHRVWLVAGNDGLNEITPAGRTKVWEFVTGQEGFQEFWLNPQEYGLPLHDLEDIKCLNLDQAEEIFWQVLENKSDPAVMDTVILNSAAGLYAYGRANNYSDALILAKEALHSGQALAKFMEFKKEANAYPHL